jgi:hypothetical protein
MMIGRLPYIVMGKAGGSQLLNTTTGQIFAQPGNTQTMMITRLNFIKSRRVPYGKAEGFLLPVARVLGSIPASSDTVESEERQMKGC